ncbi:hypothetical protein PR202_ga02003 [Eleusine coracana subsp. coracana]|uniref:Uncharacterized protein n=1 Tax=Eleusine coracana subsp. coracana TaxID=191504 RepID=A0AAV5BJC1_ELECO|nr:hypothetical protein QOZ80_2AG0137730 [Eleusine coracana subsp. coracana]GJM85542.1 hypothetical protein PR202_ga01316 [Eleusine coracana subsp. coracana]GJM86170.1 hypothetical protein PR202_ga02003 [Eleusine coracana subsp. coracana]
MESRRHHQRSRSARGPAAPLPPHGHHARQPPTPRSRRNPYSPFADPFLDFPMEEDAVSALMDIDESPLNGAGFLDEDDGDADLYVGPSRGGRGGIAMDMRVGPLPFADFFNSFDGADFDDTDLE